MTKTVSFQHQVEDTATLVKHPAFAIFSEMGTGKSKIVIDAACTLAEQGKIDTVVVVVPASVRCVWLDPEIGEIKKHAWRSCDAWEYHEKTKLVWSSEDRGGSVLQWIITNYEFLRSGARLEALLGTVMGRDVLLVCDESSYIKNRTARQTKAILKLRKHCARCVLLNGTPVTNSPLDLWSQMQVLSPDILEKRFKNFYHFRSEFCEMRTVRFGLRAFPQIKAYRRLDKLAQIVAPHVLRREKKDCLDLPPKLYTEREMALTPESWKRYQELKKDALMSLPSGDIRLEPNAVVRIIRLAQLTSGVLGGVHPSIAEDPERLEKNEITGEWCGYPVQDLSDEKLCWAVQYLTEECTAKAVIVWCRFRRERERLAVALCGEIAAFQLYGGQSKDQRSEAVEWFSVPKTENDKKCVLIAQQHAGSHGLNLIAATEHIFLSNDFSLGIRLQAEDRSHRPGQINPVTYIDVLATGPKGEKTIDHIIFKALRDKKNVADLTTAEWRKELENV